MENNIKYIPCMVSDDRVDTFDCPQRPGDGMNCNKDSSGCIYFGGVFEFNSEDYSGCHWGNMVITNDRSN